MKNARKITSVLIVATITMGMFVGCGSKTTADASTTTQTTGVTQKNDSSTMKTTYLTVLKALVTNKTITQVQSDKVLALVSKAMPKGGGRASGGGKADGQKPSGTNQKNGEKQSGTREAGGANSRNNQLASLVTSKVITQVQANTIGAKVQAAMKSMQGTKTN